MTLEFLVGSIRAMPNSALWVVLAPHFVAAGIFLGARARLFNFLIVGLT